MGDKSGHSKVDRLLATNEIVGKHRWDVYRHVLGRINTCVDSGFYIEAVSLMESFITDRLESYMLAHEVPVLSGDSFYKRIKSLMDSDTDFDKELLKSIDVWRKMRNTAVHGMAKFKSLEEADWTKKMECIENAAKEGKKLLGPVKKATAHKSSYK